MGMVMKRAFVNSLGRVDLKPDSHLLAGILDILVHPRGAEPRFHPLVLRVRIPRVGVPIRHLQVHRLVFFVLGPRAAHARQNVKGDPVVRFGVFDPPAPVRGSRGGVIRRRGFQGPGRLAPEEVGFQPRIEDAAVETQGRVERRPHVPHLLQFGPDAARPERVFVAVEKDRAAIPRRGQRRVGGLRGQHPAPHRGVGPFDLGDVQEPGRVPDEGSAGKGAFRDRLEPPLVQRPSPVRDAFSALQHGRVDRMVFELLELAVRGEPGVGVVQTHDETEGNQVVPEMIHPATAVGRGWEGVSHRVHHLSLPKAFRLDFPYLFQPQRVRLRLAVSPQVESLHDLLGEASMAAFREQGESSMELHPSLKRRFRFSVATDAQVVGRDTLDRSIIGVVQHLARRKAWIDFHPQLLRSLSEPFAELIQADDVISVVVHLRRSGYGDGAVPGQKAHLVMSGRRRMFKPQGVWGRDPVRQ